MNDTERKLRFLIHPDDAAYPAITRALLRATQYHPEHWDLIFDRQNTVDHVGYSDSTLTAVVWAHEHETAFHRLSIRPGRHEVFDELLSIVLS